MRNALGCCAWVAGGLQTHIQMIRISRAMVPTTSEHMSEGILRSEDISVYAKKIERKKEHKKKTND